MGNYLHSPIIPPSLGRALLRTQPTPSMNMAPATGPEKTIGTAGMRGNTRPSRALGGPSPLNTGARDVVGAVAVVVITSSTVLAASASTSSEAFSRENMEGRRDQRFSLFHASSEQNVSEPTSRRPN